MESSKNDKFLQDKLKLLIKYISEGKLHFAEDLREKLNKSLLNVEYDENGDINIDTVDPIVKSLGTMVSGMDHDEKLRDSISLLEIQRMYFQILEINFGEQYNQMLSYKKNPHEYSYVITRDQKNVSILTKTLHEFLYIIESFWKDMSEVAYVHMRSLKGYKFVYGGDFFPQENSNIASQCGVYADTIVLPCPYMRSRNSFKAWTDQQKAYYLLKFALNILRYKTAAIEDLDVPIIVIIPGKEMLGKNNYEHIMEKGTKDSLVHSSRIFSRKFESLEDLMIFCKEFKSPEKLLDQITNTELVLFDLDYHDPLIDQIKNNLSGDYGSLMKTDNAGELVGQLPLGRMINNNELLLKSAFVGGTPLMDAPTSWKYFQWKLQYDIERSESNNMIKDFHIVHGVNQLGSSKFKWLGNIPIEGLIELRKNQALHEIRQILNKGIDDLANESPLNFTRTSHRVFNNLNHAFRDHERNISKLNNKKWKIAGENIGWWLVSGSIEIAAAATGTPFWGLSTVVLNQFIDFPKLKDMPKSYKEFEATEIEKKRLKRSPTGPLFSQNRSKNE